MGILTVFLISHLSFLTSQAQTLTATEPVLDCGTTGFEVPVTATFQLWNKGQQPLRIKDVHPDCGCTKVEFPRQEIAVGESFKVLLTYDGRQLGHYYKQAAVSAEGLEEPLYLAMKGIVLADMKDYSGSYPFKMGSLLLDRNYIEFDDVNRGDQPQQELYIMNNGTKVMQPTVMHLPSYLSATVSPRRLSPGHAGLVTLTLNTDKVHDLGLTQTSVYIGQQLGEKVSSKNELPVSVVLLPDLKSLSGGQKQFAPKLQLSAEAGDINAPVIDLGSFDGKAKKSGEITLFNGGRTALDISSLQMFTPGLKVTLGKRQLKAGESTKLKVTAFRDRLKTARSAPRVLMITNDPDHAKVTIVIKAKE